MENFTVSTVWVFVTGLLCFTATSTASDITVTKFLERDKAKFQLVNVLKVREGVRSRLSCSEQCATHNNCGAVLYHQMTRSCTLAQAVGHGVTGLDTDLRLLSVKTELCPQKDGFTHLQISRLNYCLKMSSTQQNYANSRAACQAYGGDLYTMDGNSAKTDHFSTLVRLFLDRRDQFWIGLDDLQKEGTFVWAYNGRALSNTEMRALPWAPGQPSNYDNDEDCTMVSNGNRIELHENSCSRESFYLCEIHLE